MKTSKQSHQRIKESNPLKLIELAGRTCYKSENKIGCTLPNGCKFKYTPNSENCDTCDEHSSYKFSRMLTKIGHHSVLEHASICFEVDSHTIYYLWYRFLSVSNSKIKYVHFTYKHRYLISANFRTWLEVLNQPFTWPIKLIRIKQYLSKKYPVIFSSLAIDRNGLKDMQPTEEKDMSAEEAMVHATRTYRFITNRGISHEIVRHRPWAYSQESTRYVDYVKDILFIKPTHLEKAGMLQKICWYGSMKMLEVTYKTLRKLGCRKENARGVLPNDLKTEIVCTANLNEWKYMLNLRTGKAAHPQMRELMKPVLDEFRAENLNFH